MSLVRTCLWCGYVCEPRAERCDACGEPLTGPAYEDDRLRPGDRIEVGRADASEVAHRLGKGIVVVLPDRRIGVVRRRLLPPRRGGLDLEDAMDEMVGGVYDTFGPMRGRGVGMIAGAVGLVVGAAAAILRTLDLAGRLLFELATAPFSARTIEARFDRGRPMYWKVRGWRRSREAVEEIALALSAGDLQFAPSGGRRWPPED